MVAVQLGDPQCQYTSDSDVMGSEEETAAEAPVNLLDCLLSNTTGGTTNGKFHVGEIRQCAAPELAIPHATRVQLVAKENARHGVRCSFRELPFLGWRRLEVNKTSKRDSRTFEVTFHMSLVPRTVPLIQ